MIILFAIHLKHSSFWPSAVAKPLQDEQVHAMLWQCISVLSMCRLQSLLVNALPKSIIKRALNDLKVSL
jgi:hypothetical protein